MGSSKAPLFLLVIAASACTASSLPAPVIDAIVVDNSQKIIGDDVDRSFVVLGENFSAGVIADAGNPDASKADPLRLSISRQGDLDAAPIFVLGTMHSSTELTGWISPEADPFLDRGVYDVTVHNADGTARTFVGGFELGFRATTALFSGTQTEPPDGTDNEMTASLRLAAADGGPGWVRAPFAPALVVVSGAEAVASFAGVDQFAAFSDEPLSVLVTDSALESVTIQVTSLPATVSTSAALVLYFIAGPGASVRVLPAAEVNVSDDFAQTEIRVEDAWGNPATNHPDYGVNFSTSICAGATVNPDTLTIPGGIASMPITVFCATTNDTFVSFAETTSTTLENGGIGVITFD